MKLDGPKKLLVRLFIIVSCWKYIITYILMYKENPLQIIFMGVV